MRYGLVLLCLGSAFGAAGCADSRLQYVEKSVKQLGAGKFEVASIKKTGEKQAAAAGLPQYEIKFEGEARITKDFEVLSESDAGAAMGQGRLDTITYQDNDRLLQLFEPGKLQAGRIATFKSTCLLLKTPEYGWTCGNIRKSL